jgi:hypothetical protein
MFQSLMVEYSKEGEVAVLRLTSRSRVMALSPSILLAENNFTSTTPRVVSERCCGVRVDASLFVAAESL